MVDIHGVLSCSKKDQVPQGCPTVVAAYVVASWFPKDDEEHGGLIEVPQPGRHRISWRPEVIVLGYRFGWLAGSWVQEGVWWARAVRHMGEKRHRCFVVEKNGRYLWCT